MGGNRLSERIAQRKSCARPMGFFPRKAEDDAAGLAVSESSGYPILNETNGVEKEAADCWARGFDAQKELT